MGAEGVLSEPRPTADISVFAANCPEYLLLQQCCIFFLTVFVAFPYSLGR